MNFEYTDEEIKAQKEFSVFCREHIAPFSGQMDKAPVEGRCRLVRENLLKLAGQGYTGINLPVQYGGMGMTITASLPFHESLAGVCASTFTAVDASSGMVGRLLERAGSGVQKDAYLKGIVRGNILACFAVSEEEVGADVSDISTRAQKVEKGWLLNGRKSMIANSRGFNVAVVTAYTEKEAGLGGLSFFVVPADNPGIKCCQHVETMGLRGALFGNILFENCLVPPDAIVGEPGAGFELYNELLTEGKIRCSAMAAGMAKRLLELSLKYAAEKKIKGKSIFRNQEYSFKIADMHTMIDTSVQLTRYAAWRYDKGENKSQTEVSVNCAKVFSSEAASKIAHMAMQIFGEHGYRDGSMVERIYRDSRFCELSMGGTESQRALIAGEVLKSYA